MSVLVLCSGGMDSVISYYFKLTTHDGPVHMLTFDYGQRHRAEISKAQYIFTLSNSQGFNHKDAQHLIVKLDGVMPQVGSLMSPTIPVLKYNDAPPHSRPSVPAFPPHPPEDDAGQDPSYIPYRNLLFLSVAATWARHLDCVELVTGLRGGFPDCTEEFERAVEKAIQVASPEYRLVISSPVHRSRAESLKLARQLHGCWDALAHTLTCFEGTEPPCGFCLPCKKRAEGFSEIGYPDPMLRRVMVAMLPRGI